MSSRSVLVFLAAAAVAACSDPAVFRRAPDAPKHEPVKDAFRVQQPPQDCPVIGTVHAESDESTIADIAKTTARHGGTHYVVRGDKTEATGNHTGTVIGPAITIEQEKLRRTWAEVYRCAK